MSIRTAPVAAIPLALALAAMAGCGTMGPRAPAVAHLSCADTAIPIYFAENSADLSGPARDVIADAGRQAAKCTVLEVEITGLADYRGAADANLALSRLRAEHVAAALEKAGLPGPKFAPLVVQGEAGAIKASGDAEPLRRRAEVRIRFKR